MAVDISTLDEEQALRYSCSLLISQRFVSQGRLIKSSGAFLKDRNPEFTFICNHFDDIERRLAEVGFDLERDPDPRNRWVRASGAEGVSCSEAPLGIDPSRFLVACAVHYARSLSEVGDWGMLDASIEDVLAVLVTDLGVYKQKPSKALIADSMLRLERSRLVKRMGGKWSDDDVSFAIMPAIEAATSPAVIARYEEFYAEGLAQDDQAFEEVFGEVEGEEDDE